MAATVPAFVVSSMRKVFPDTPVPRPPKEPKPPLARMSAAGGEYEAFQFVLVPPSGERPDVESVTVCDLTGDAGTLSAEHVTVRRVQCVWLEHPSHRETRAGRFPDILMPEVAGRLEGTTSFWVTVHVPPKTRPGLYRGTLSVKPDGLAESCAIELTVRSFSLPQRPALITAYGLYDKPMREQYGDRSDEMLRRFRDNLRAHRVTHLSFPATDIPPPVATVKDGRPSVDYTAFDGSVEENLKYGLNALDVPAPLRYHARECRLELPHGEDATTKILADYQQHLEERGWLDMAYFFVIDEPGDKHIADLRHTHELLARGAPRIKRRCDFGYGAYGHGGGIEPQVAKYRQLAGLFEIWVPHIDCVDYDFLSERQAKGDWVWWYICCSAVHPYPNFLVDYPGVDNRVPFWMLHKYGVNGFAYWTVNWWKDDVFRHCVTFGTAVGDGLLVYPGPDGPIDSIRWEIMRDGFEDYEYLAMLSSLIAEAEEAGVAADALAGARAALAKTDLVAASAISYTNEPAVIEQVRAAVADQIEALRAALGKRD